MKPATYPPVPPGLDLGNLAAVKVGDELAILSDYPDGPLTVRPSVCVVHSITPDLVRVRNPKKATASGAFWWKHGGCAQYAMLHRFYYYSANPAHIEEAKAKKAAEEAEAKRKAEAFAAMVALALPSAQQLADPDTYTDSDGHEHNDAEKLARSLAEKLTTEQLATLADWLNVSPATSTPSTLNA